jgi:hypothetical protein
MSDFWKSIYEISEQQRQMPDELRALAGVPKQQFHWREPVMNPIDPYGIFDTVGFSFETVSPKRVPWKPDSELKDVLNSAIVRFGPGSLTADEIGELSDDLWNLIEERCNGGTDAADE